MRPRFSSRAHVCQALVTLEAEVVLWLVVTQVRLYMDCEEYHRVAFNRSPRPLTFEAGSGIFVGNAGGTGLTKFVVSWMLPILVFVMTSSFLVLARPDLRPEMSHSRCHVRTNVAFGLLPDTHSRREQQYLLAVLRQDGRGGMNSVLVSGSLSSEGS